MFTPECEPEALLLKPVCSVGMYCIRRHMQQFIGFETFNVECTSNGLLIFPKISLNDIFEPTWQFHVVHSIVGAGIFKI
jgi:hypothetical protein